MKNLKNKNLIIGILVLAVIVLTGVLILPKKEVVEPIELKDNGTDVVVEEIQDNQQIDEDYGHEIESIEDLIDTTEETNPLPKIDTTGWKTYRNEEMGFEVKIPEDWEGRIRDDGVDFRKQGEIYEFEGAEEYAVSLSFGSRYNANKLTLIVLIKKRKEYYNEKYSKITIGDADAVINFYPQNCLNSTNVYIDDIEWIIEFILCSDEYNKEYNIYLGMLQTFQFID